jgi:hypothetical protein
MSKHLKKVLALNIERLRGGEKYGKPPKQQQCVEVIVPNITIFRFSFLIAKLIPLTLDIASFCHHQPKVSSLSEICREGEPFFHVKKTLSSFGGLFSFPSSPTQTVFPIEILFSCATYFEEVEVTAKIRADV